MSIRKYFILANVSRYRIKGEGWKGNEKVYGIFKENNCIYVGKSVNIEKRMKFHLNGKYKNCCCKELKIGDNKNINWEKIYIQWYSLKYKLENKEWIIKESKVSIKDKNRLLPNFYKAPYKKYQKDIILKYHLL